MYVRVKKEEKEYYSYVFAHFQLDYMPQHVVFDPVENKFDLVASFSQSSGGHRQIGFMNENEKDFVFKKELDLNVGVVKKCAGYAWLVEDINLLNDICDGKPVDQKYKNLAVEMNQTIDPDAWNEVVTKQDADDMMEHVGGFHDWYLTSISANSDPYEGELISTVQLKFRSQAAFDVLVEFEGAYIQYNFCPANRIYLSSIVLDGDLVYWVDGEEDLSVDDVKNYDHVVGNKLRWKFVLKEKCDWQNF